MRREKESAFRKSCISRGILPNANATFAPAMRAQHAFIATYYDDVHSVDEDSVYDMEKKRQSDDMARELRAVGLRSIYIDV